MAENQSSQTQEKATYISLIGVFLGLFAAFSKREQDRRRGIDISPMDLALLGLSTYRIGRLVTFDRVTEPLRAPVTETQPDPYGTSETVGAKGSGVQKAIGELVACPTCTGTWAAAVLVYALRLAPRPTRLFLAFMAATGLAELLDSANEALSWTGAAKRKQATPE
jgi:hypothetical protein